MKITDELFNRLAELSRLEFKPEEKEQIKADLSRMIEMVEKLNELNTENVEPLAYLGNENNMFRDDEIQETITREEALMNVPVKNDEYILVPKMIKKPG